MLCVDVCIEPFWFIQQPSCCYLYNKKLVLLIWTDYTWYDQAAEYKQSTCPFVAFSVDVWSGLTIIYVIINIILFEIFLYYTVPFFLCFIDN